MTSNEKIANLSIVCETNKYRVLRSMKIYRNGCLKNTNKTSLKLQTSVLKKKNWFTIVGPKISIKVCFVLFILRSQFIFLVCFKGIWIKYSQSCCYLLYSFEQVYIRFLKTKAVIKHGSFKV